MLDGPPYPHGFEYLWLWYIEVSAGRQSGMNGPNPISWSEIDSWSRMTRRHPQAWEVDIIKMIDGVFLGDVHDRQRKEREKMKSKQRTAAARKGGFDGT